MFWGFGELWNGLVISAPVWSGVESLVVVVVSGDSKGRALGGGVIARKEMKSVQSQVEGRLGMARWLELAQGHLVETVTAESLLGAAGGQSASWQPAATI